MSNIFSVHVEQSTGLSYTSLQTDEAARSHQQCTIPKVGRDHSLAPPNGNLRMVVPDIDNAEVRSHLSPYQQVNTSTRTVFNTDRVYETHDSMFDKVSSPTYKNSAIKQSGHISMASMPPADPRQQHMPLPTSVDLGPGCYEPGALNGTGTPEPWALEQSHHTLPLHKNPCRGSPAFKSPDRAHTMEEINSDKRHSGHPSYFLPPDYASWTAKGMHMSHGLRNIQAERWGHSLREPRPPASELSQSMEDLQYDKSGLAATCAARAQDPNTPSYNHVFGSNMPRTMARTAHRKNDTRMRVKTYEKMITSGTGGGPGSYNTDQIRFKSHHAAHVHARGYRAQGESVFPEDKLRTAFSGGLSPSSSPKFRSASGRVGALASPRSLALNPHQISASMPSSPTRHPYTLPEDMQGALTSPLLSPQNRLPAPWADSPTATTTADHSPASSPRHPLPPTHAHTSGINGPTHATLLGELLPPGHAPAGLHTARRTDRPASGASLPAAAAAVDRALEQDWAVHQFVVSAAYASADELRGVETIASRALSSPNSPAIRLAPLTPPETNQGARHADGNQGAATEPHHSHQHHHAHSAGAGSGGFGHSAFASQGQGKGRGGHSAFSSQGQGKGGGAGGGAGHAFAQGGGGGGGGGAGHAFKLWNPEAPVLALIEEHLKSHLSWEGAGSAEAAAMALSDPTLQPWTDPAPNPTLDTRPSHPTLDTRVSIPAAAQSAAGFATAPASPTFWSPKAASAVASSFVEQRQGGVALEINTRLPGDDHLAFLRRNIPHKDLIRQQLKAVGELRAARKDVRTAAAQ